MARVSKVLGLGYIQGYDWGYGEIWVVVRVRETVMVNTTRNPNLPNQTVENSRCQEH